jgi:hypothetical protein
MFKNHKSSDNIKKTFLHKTLCVKKIIDDNREKMNALLKTHLHIKDAEIELKEESANISIKHKIPSQAQEEFKKSAERAIPGIKNVSFAAAKEANK